ncbi:MAG TPA: SMC family ATPase, partial [Pyrinomonadaceae bacterium]|nr:SMC family ATPase [Pyrinomonadaceae bacterium]
MENIKCYETARFDFSLGSTAIIGKNGSGKTTIIEAIAWALFDVLDYRRDDFVSRGKKRGRVKVIFESASDQRDYQVTRDTAGAYYVYDPVLDLRPAERKEDVLRFLTRHLGFEPGTDIGAIFRQAIGVAQGNFTSIFLATPSERKRVFDSLLKVEEYTKAAENLLSTTRWVESQLYRIGQEIARREASLEHLSRIGIEINQLENEVKAAGNESASLTNQLVELESKLRSDEELEKVLSETQNKISLLTEALKRETERLQEAENNLAEALKAKEIIVETQESAQKYKEAELRLADLENLRQNREKLRIDLAKTDAALSSVKNDKSRIQEEIEKIHLARKKIAELEPLAKIEADLTEHYNKLNEQSAPLEALQKIAADTNRKILALRNEFKQVKKRIDEIKALTADALSLQSLRDSESEIAKKIGIITGRIERDKKFREEIRGGLCPILSEKCLNLKPGQTLDQFLDDESSELFSELESLQAENKKIHSAIARALEIENQRLTLPQLEVRLDEIKAEGEKLKLELENL